MASILIGKVAERASASDFYDSNAWLDVAFPHVVFVSGRRGSGKSYDLGIIAEGFAAEPGSNFSSVGASFCTVLFDLQSQFWTMGSGLDQGLQQDQQQNKLVEKWGLDGSVKSAQIYLPSGSAEVTGSEEPFVVPPSSMELADWLSLLDVERFDPMGQLLRTTLEIARLDDHNFSLPSLITLLQSPSDHSEISRFQQSTLDALEWRLLALKDLGLFEPGETVDAQILRKGATSIFLLRELDDGVKSVVVATVMRQIERAMSRYHQRLKVEQRQKKNPSDSEFPSRVWVLIDEAHLVCPSEKKTSANSVIVDYVKRGRDAGLSLVLATQQPSALDSAAISQVDLSIIHRLTFEADISAALHRLPSPLPSNVTLGGKDVSDPRHLIRELAPGECLVSDAEASRSFIMRARPRICPHGGGEPAL